MTIKGERGEYTLTQRETNPRTGKSWFCLIGGPSGVKQWRFKYPCDVKLARGQKRVELDDPQPEVPAADEWSALLQVWAGTAPQ